MSGRGRITAAAGVLLAAALMTAPAGAQVKASEHATLSQTIDGTVISMEYHRPSLRGRGNLFGGQVHWGEVWTPGANWATILDVSKDIELSGHPVPAGRYSVWMVVNPEEWEFVLEPEDSVYHTAPPELTDDQIRFMFTPEETDQVMETLAFSFPEVRWNGGILRFHWGETLADFAVVVESTYQLTVTPEQAEPYLGSYEMVWSPPPGAEVPPDTMTTVISLVDGRMVESGQSFPDDPDVVYQQFYIPRGEGFFIAGMMVNGEVWEIFDEGVFEFFLDDDGRATGFEMRGPGDELWMRGWRVP